MYATAHLGTLVVVPNVSLKEDTIYFAIGAYNALDKQVYLLMCNNVWQFIQRAQNGGTYSSLWFAYTSLCETYRLGQFTWQDRVGRMVKGFTNKYLRDLHDTIFSIITKNTHLLSSEASEQSDDNQIDFIDFTEEVKKYKDQEVLPRNAHYRKLAIERENCTCELCGTQHTFVDTSGNEYFEGHHLIMYNPSVQRRFKYCLDHPDNIICLCPNCHKKIHNSSEDVIRALVLQLFKKHNTLLKIYGILDAEKLNTIIQDYTN